MGTSLYIEFVRVTFLFTDFGSLCVFLPEESQGRGSLMGCHLQGHTESDTTEAT